MYKFNSTKLTIADTVPHHNLMKYQYIKAEMLIEILLMHVFWIYVFHVCYTPLIVIYETRIEALEHHHQDRQDAQTCLSE